MMQAAKRKRARKAPKEKDGVSRQTSLLDAFGAKVLSSNKNTPTVSATTSENESAGPSDIIDICSSDAEPMSEDNFPAAPLPLSSKPSDASSRDEAVQIHEGLTCGISKDVPIIIIDSSPSTSPVRASKPLPRDPPKALFSIFAPHQRSTDRQSSQQPSARGTTAPTAPFPDANTQHVRGPQTNFRVSGRYTRALPPSSPRAQNSMKSFSRSRLMREGSLYSESSVQPVVQSRQEPNLANIPEEHRSYPAVGRLLQQSSWSVAEAPEAPTQSHLLWNDKWRPRRAEEVLGNEQAALYLRDWLLALRLHINTDDVAPTSSQPKSDRKGKLRARGSKGKSKETRGVKRPRIIRDVQKKRRRVDSEEPEPWIAEDSTDEEVPLDDILESEGDYFSTKLSRLKRAETEKTLTEPPSSPAPLPPPEDLPAFSPETSLPFSHNSAEFGDTVYNTILLNGPHGCGKTAAVYACAEELGWDVFEVYPGIGERSGGALNKLVGEVGKNHLVRQTQQQQPKGPRTEKPVWPKANFFAKRVVSDDEDEYESTQDAPAGQEPSRAPTSISQSIILIEEVDVLFKDDSNFWSTLTKIIKECRRPVVLTCNDMTLVPLEDLPLQTTLHFYPCPVSLATSYLYALCAAEGRPVDRDVIARMYEAGSNCTNNRPADSSVHPESVQQSPPDLRRTINQLQLGEVSIEPSKSITGTSASRGDQSLEALIRVAKSISLYSYVDYGLRRPGGEVLRDLLLNNHSPSADEQLGYRQFATEPGDMESDLPVTFTFYHWDEVINDDLLAFSRQHYPVPDCLSLHTADPHPLHAEHCGALLPALDRLHVPRDQLVRDAQSVFVDYEPYIRFMSRIDDARIAANVANGKFEGTRRTRNSQRARWETERWLFLGDEELDILRQTAFKFDVDSPQPDISAV
ncbi:hypothetical protein BN946_scf184976.g28 [Trametes cinnabarina]|uniref:Uncharacterized protein n=1 Tax=Pycnoporus cinnabarinus TaxID=5643 RepID=A0A060SAM8_PYCCI|nr:hypothetical protein BN946_scf184976.g28 [Trametes cinnabarina]